MNDNLNLKELDLESCSSINGGHPLFVAIGGAAIAAAGVVCTFVGLYDFGYNYAKRHLEKSK